MEKAKEPIFTAGFIVLCAANFAFFIAFYMLLPVLPFYLLDDLGAGESIAGVLLSVYVLAAIVARPIGGYLIDRYPRKKLFLIAALVFALHFAGYVWLDALLLLGALRIAHGLSWGVINSSVMTLAVDVIPKTRMGAGIGFFGIASSITMALGPWLGMSLYDAYSAKIVFEVALAIALFGVFLGLFAPNVALPAPRREGPGDERTLLEKLFLKKAAREAVALLAVGFVYGLVLNYVSVFARNQGFTLEVGHFFLFLAGGMVLSRLFAGRFIDGSALVGIVILSKALMLAALLLIALTSRQELFFPAALLFGVGAGIAMPAYQTMFVLRARPDQRGVANASFFTAWDGGIGAALLSGGVVAALSSYAEAYLIGAGFLAASLIFFAIAIGPFYSSARNRL